MAPKRKASSVTLEYAKRTKATTPTASATSTLTTLQDFLNTIQPDDPRKDYKKDVFRAAFRTPRFIFRGFWTGSGGNSALNTDQAITPHAFYQQTGPATLFDLPRQEAAGLAANHFFTRFVDTPFSSWSHSIRTAFDFAIRDQRPGAHLAIADTKRLPSHNLVIHTPELTCLGPGIPSDAFEFLAFGVIRGEAFRAVSAEAIFACMPASAKAAMQGRWGLDAVLRKLDFAAVEKIAALFGDYFRLPVMVALSTYRLQLSNAAFARPALDEANATVGMVEASQFRLGALAAVLLQRGYEVPADWEQDLCRGCLTDPPLRLELQGSEYGNMTRVLRTLVELSKDAKQQAAQRKRVIEERKKARAVQYQRNAEMKARACSLRGPPQPKGLEDVMKALNLNIDMKY